MSNEISNGCIDHLAIAVENLEESINLYCNGLGFEEIERRTTHGKHSSMISAVVKKGTSCIVLVQGLQPESQICQFISKYGAGVQHMAISVENLDEAIAKMKDQNVAPEFDIIEGEGIRQVFLQRDKSSGVRLELIERNGGNFNDDSVELLYKAFEARNLY
jgi:methylmalonyl-CoA/ethylmalonyl-CoA epimerase